MSSHAHDRLSDLFLRAVDLDDADRAALLDQECAGDPSLRSRVERLIAMDEGASGLDTPVGPAAASVLLRSDPQQRRRVGAYEIHGVLGRGGMATVYRATQANPARDVALKILNIGATSEDIARRFALEASALARLSHPGIAAVYEAGIEGAGPSSYAFIAMELVDGVPLTAWASLQKLTLPQRALLLAQVCDAVQHAHQRGVIHRDLKPANILVTHSAASAQLEQGSQGQPKVLDFGVARFADAADAGGDRADGNAMHTIPGVVIGTLAYMSPEQLDGSPDAIDTRTDIFALGVILFELVMGTPPVKVSGLSINEAVTRLRTAHASAHEHASMIGGSRELASIYAKATQPDPTQRYASAGELGDDLRRWVAHEPIRAQPPTLRYTFKKWARRNPALLGMSIAAGLVAVAGLAAFAWQARLTQQSALIAQREAKAAEAVTRFIERTFGSVDARSDGPNARVADMLERAATLNERENADSPEVMARLASLFGRSFLSLGMRDRSEAQLRLAVGAFPTLDSEHALTARQFLANVLRHTRQREEGLEVAKGVFADRVRISGPRATATLFAQRSLGVQRLALGDAAGAIADLREAIAGYEAIGAQGDSDAMHAGSDLAMALAAKGERDEAIALLDALYAKSSSLLKPAHPTTLNISNRLANLLTANGEAARAEAICRAELERSKGSLTLWHPVRMRIVAELGKALRVQGKLDEAIAMLQEGRAIESPGQVDLGAVTELWAQLARALLDTGRPDEAAPLIEAVIQADRDEPRHAYSGASRRAELLGLGR